MNRFPTLLPALRAPLVHPDCGVYHHPCLRAPARAGLAEPSSRGWPLRSVKLVALFTLLNVGAALVFSGPHGGADRGLSSIVGGWFDIYIIGGSRCGL